MDSQEAVGAEVDEEEEEIVESTSIDSQEVVEAEVDEEEEEIVKELPVSEKMIISEHMVLSSPPGHVSDQIADLRKLIGSEVLDEEKGKILAHAHNVQTGRVATRTAEGKRFVITKEGGRPHGRFLDPSTNELVLIDPFTAVEVEGSPVEDATPYPESVAELLAAIQSSLSSYVRRKMPSGKSASSIFCSSESPDCAEEEGSNSTIRLIAYISSENVNTRNWWSGAWLGRYVVDWCKDGIKATISGKITVRAHYYENGNIQLQTSDEVGPQEIHFREEQPNVEIAEDIVKEIEKADNELHSQLETMYGNMGDTLKAYRRSKPIKAGKFSWNLNQVRMVKNLNRKPM